MIQNIDTLPYQCEKCQFGTSANIKPDDSTVTDPAEPVEATGRMKGAVKAEQVPVPDASKDAATEEEGIAGNKAAADEERTIAAKSSLTHHLASIQKVKLPDELFLLIFDLLETEDLLSFAEALPKIADVITEFNVIRTRELRCFCLKKDYMTAKLGVGISVTSEEKGNWDFVTSEFDIVSEAAFELGR